MTTEYQNAASPDFAAAMDSRLAQTLESKIAADVKSLKNQIIKISYGGGLNRFRYERIRAPLVASERTAGLIPGYVRDVQSTVGLYAYLRTFEKLKVRRNYIEISFSKAIDVLEFEALPDEQKAFLRERKFDDRDASATYLELAYALAGAQPDRSLDIARQLLLHATRAFCDAHYYAWSQDDLLTTLLCNAFSQHLAKCHGMTERRYEEGYLPYWQGLRSMAEYVAVVTQAHIGSYGDRSRKSASAEAVMSICDVALMLSVSLTIWPREATTNKNRLALSRYFDRFIPRSP